VVIKYWVPIGLPVGEKKYYLNLDQVHVTSIDKKSSTYSYPLSQVSNSYQLVISELAFLAGPPRPGPPCPLRQPFSPFRGCEDTRNEEVKVKRGLSCRCYVAAGFNVTDGMGVSISTGVGESGR
jgi:hypothetical protein